MCFYFESILKFKGKLQIQYNDSFLLELLKLQMRCPITLNNLVCISYRDALIFLNPRIMNYYWFPVPQMHPRFPSYPQSILYSQRPVPVTHSTQGPILFIHFTAGQAPQSVPPTTLTLLKRTGQSSERMSLSFSVCFTVLSLHEFWLALENNDVQKPVKCLLGTLIAIRALFPTAFPGGQS